MKIVYTLALVLGTINFFIGQCDNNVSTDPLSPANSSLPINPNNYGNKFLNQFDWNERTIDGTLATYQLQNMQFNQNMQNVMSNQAIQYYNYIAKGEQLLPKHGWELLLLNLGKYPNLDDFPIAGEFTDIPYIVLYNRYSGIIRVFANYGNGFLPNGINFDAVRVELRFDDNNVNGLLRLNQGLDQALDQKSNVTKVSGIAKHPNSPGRWFSTDFQVAYDPCICYHPSRIRLNFHFAKGEDIVLQGREIEIESNIIDGYEVFGKDFLTNFDASEIDNPEKGSIIMYDAMDFLVEDYIKKTQNYKDSLDLVNEHNKEVNFNLAVVKLFNTVVLKGGSKLISAYIFDPIYENLVDEMTSKSIFKKDSVRLDKLEKFTLNAFNSGVGNLNTFVSKNFKKMDNPTKPVMPSATFSEMIIKGSISDTIPIEGPNFYTPGTYGSEGTPLLNLDNYFEYPIYNDALGTFALLETPKIEISKTIGDNTINVLTQEEDNFSNTNVVFLRSQRYQSWTKNYQIKLVTDLKYALNSVLDIESHSVQAAFSIKAIPKKIDNINHTIFNCFQDPLYNINFVSSNTNIDETTAIVARANPYLYNKTNPNYDRVYFGYGGGSIAEPTINKEFIEYKTPFLDINNFFPLVSSIGLRNEAISYREQTVNIDDLDDSQYTVLGNDFKFTDPNDPMYLKPYTSNYSTDGYEFDLVVELKLIVDIEFKTKREDGTPNSVTQILTYKIDSITWLTEEIIEQYPFGIIAGEFTDLTIMPENLTFLNTNFNGSSIQGCKLIGNTYTCQAWNDITINGVLTTSNGYTVDIFAGNNIEELPESDVSPEIVLDIKQILDFSHPMPEATSTYVSNFCKGLNPNAPAYQAKSASGKYGYSASTQDSILEQENILEHKPFDFTLYPNPANAQTRIALQNSTFNEVSASVYDVMGKKINVEITQIGENSLSLNVSHLEKGVYFVKVKSNFEEKTKQLVVN